MPTAPFFNSFLIVNRDFKSLESCLRALAESIGVEEELEERTDRLVDCPFPSE